MIRYRFRDQGLLFIQACSQRIDMWSRERRPWIEIVHKVRRERTHKLLLMAQPWTVRGSLTIRQLIRLMRTPTLKIKRFSRFISRRCHKEKGRGVWFLLRWTMENHCKIRITLRRDPQSERVKEDHKKIHGWVRPENQVFRGKEDRGLGLVMKGVVTIWIQSFLRIGEGRLRLLRISSVRFKTFWIQS